MGLFIRISLIMSMAISAYAASSLCNTPTEVHYFGIQSIQVFNFSGSTVNSVNQVSTQDYDSPGQVPVVSWNTSTLYLGGYRASCIWTEQMAQYIQVHANGSVVSRDSTSWVRFIDNIELGAFGAAPWVWFLADTAGHGAASPSHFLVSETPVQWKATASRRDSLIGNGNITVRSSSWNHYDSALAVNGLLSGFTAEESGHGYIYSVQLQKTQYQKMVEPPVFTHRKGSQYTATKQSQDVGMVAVYSTQGVLVYQGTEWNNQNYKPGLYIVKPINVNLKSWTLVR